MLAARCASPPHAPLKNGLPAYARTASDATPSATHSHHNCSLPRGKTSRKPGMSHGYERTIVGAPTAAPNHHLRMRVRYSARRSVAGEATAGITGVGRGSAVVPASWRAALSVAAVRAVLVMLVYLASRAMDGGSLVEPAPEPDAGGWGADGGRPRS